MALTVFTLLDLAKLNGRDKEVGLIEENLQYSPEIGIVPSRVISGTSYKATKRVGLPGGGGFRDPNSGITPGKSVFEPVLVQAYLYSKILKADPQVLNAGEDDSIEDLKALEESGSVQDAFIQLGKQFYDGTAIDGKGFPGIKSMVNTDLVEDAVGTTANTGTFVYGVKFGIQNVHFVFGKNSALQFSEWVKQLFTDGDGKQYMGEVSQLDSWMGLANGSKYSVGALKNITDDAGKGVTDDRLANLLSKYPVGYKPDRWFMNRRAARQLQKSRSTVTAITGARSSTGSEVTAPMPTESNGIPITVTDSIGDTYAIA